MTAARTARGIGCRLCLMVVFLEALIEIDVERHGSGLNPDPQG